MKREAAVIVAAEGIETEVVDPRTAAQKLDSEGICASVEKTGRLVTVEEAIGPCSIASEIAAAMSSAEGVMASSSGGDQEGHGLTAGPALHD